MSEDLKIIDENYRALILSLPIESNDIATIKDALDKEGESLHCVFMYLTSLIPGQIKLISPYYKDVAYFAKLITLFRLIRRSLDEVTNFLSMENSMWLATNALEKLNCCAIQAKETYDYAVIHGLIDLMQEQLAVYPKAIEAKIAESILFHAILTTFIQSSSARLFIYRLVPLKPDFFSCLLVNVSLIFAQLTKELPKAKDSDLLNELIVIAELFIAEFKGIYNEFYSIMNQMVYCNNIEEETKTFKCFFKAFIALVFKEKSTVCFEIVNIMMQLYEEHITNQGLCRLIVFSIFSKLNLEQYYQLNDNSDLIPKFLGQLHKTKDTELLVYYFKWLDMSTRLHSSKTVFEAKQSPLSKSFKALSKVIPLLNDSTPMLQCLIDQLNHVFAFRNDFLIDFLDQIELYQGIHALILIKKPNAHKLFHFVKDLLRLYTNESVINKLSQANLLQFDIFSNDELVLDKIEMSLVYEVNQDKFNKKCDKIVEKLNDLSFEIQNRRDCFEENVNKFIDIVCIILNSFLIEKNRKITPITVKLFKDITDVLLDFTDVLFEYEVELRLVFKLWNRVFDFIGEYNLTLLKQRFKEDNADTSLEVPIIISKEHIRRFIHDGLNLCGPENATMLLRYLYEKCLNYKSEEYDFEYPEVSLNSLQLLKFKYVFPQTFIALNEKRLSVLFLESKMMLKCLINVVLAMDSDVYLASLLAFMEFLCDMNHINASLMLGCGVVRDLLLKLGASEETDRKVHALLRKLMSNFNREDMEVYLKRVYVLLVKENNATLSQALLKNIYDSIEKAASIRNSITISSINTHNPQVYQLLYLPQAVNDSLHMLISLFIPSFQSLNKFYLCHLSNAFFSFSVLFEDNNIDLLRHGKVIQSFTSFNKELMKTNKGASVKWNNFLIESGPTFNVRIEKAAIVITIQQSVLLENPPGIALDLSIGYLNCAKDREQSLNFSEAIPYAEISYLLLMKETIPLALVNEIDSAQVNCSMGKSVIQLQPELKWQLFKDCLPLNWHKDVLTEISFNEIGLVNAQSVFKLIESVKAYSFDKDYIAFVTSNTGLKKDSKLFMLKHSSVLEYASMNDIFKLGAMSKASLRMKLYSIHSNINLSLNNSFFANVFFSYLTEMSDKLFIRLYHTVFNIILKLPSLRKLFFAKYLSVLHLVFLKHIDYLDKEFATCLLMNPEIPLETEFSAQCVMELYLNLRLFPNLPKDVQAFFLEKFYIFFHSSDINNPSAESKLFFNIIKKLIDLLLHAELHRELAEALKAKAEEIVELFFSEDKLIELEMLATHYLAVIAGYAEYKESKINTPDLQFLNSKVIGEQLALVTPFMNKLIEEGNDLTLISLSEDECYLIDHFKLEYNCFKESLKYSRMLKKGGKTLRLVWPELFADYSDYAWALSSSEGHWRMRRRLVLKENDMGITAEALQTKVVAYATHWIWLEKMALYELYSSSELIPHMIDDKDKFQSSHMCLLIKNNLKTESLLILGKKALYVITNVIVDANRKLHLSKEKSSNVFWARNENEKEWERLVHSDKRKEEGVNEFNYAAAEIKVKVIRYVRISELHKRLHLHQKNSFELFTLQGKSYFLTVFPKDRDEIFMKILKNIDSQSENSSIKYNCKSGGAMSYMKHYPIVTMRSKTRKKADAPREKKVIDCKVLASELHDRWRQYPMSNFCYLMALNTLAGRSYNDLTQYFVFPWMLKDFFIENLDPSLDVFYRDLAFPLHAQNKADRELLRRKYELKLLDDKADREIFDKNIAERRKRGEKVGKDDKYTAFPIIHSGNFYSNFSFVCYFMFRVNPFTSIAFSVKGTFDQGDRCFNCLSFFSSIKTKYQEWVPELFYFPELLVNINSNQLGVMKETKEKKSVNDVSTPPWAEMDPRTVMIVFNKIFEGAKVTSMLHSWIDLLFGFKLIGKECIEACNVFGEACYPYEDLKKKKLSKKELCQLLHETDNLGCCPIQLFLNPHSQKKLEPSSFFYEKSASIALATPKSNDILCDIASSAIGDFRAKNELPKHNISNGEGGLSSLYQYIDRRNNDDLNEEHKKKRPYYAVGKGKRLLGPKFNLILSHSKTSIFITMPKYAVAFEYNIRESSAISQVFPSLNGKFIIAALMNGTVIKFRKKNKRKEPIAFPVVDPSSKQKSSPKSSHTALVVDNSKSKLILAKYVHYESASMKDFDFWVLARTGSKNKQVTKKLLTRYYLIEIKRTGVPMAPIARMDLCESYSFLLIVDQLNYIYQYDFNSMQLMYKYHLKTVTKSIFPIKFAKIIYRTGDYVIGSNYSLNLFSINGVPMVEMNIFDILKPCPPITALEAVAVSDIIVFTGHSNGEVNIWRIRVDPYQANSRESNFSLFRTFHQRYQHSFKPKAYSFGIQKRELDDIKTIRESKAKIILLKITDDGSRLYFIDKDKKIFSLSSEEPAHPKQLKTKTTALNNIQGSSKAICRQCKKVCEETCSSFNSSGICLECSHFNSNSSLSDRLIFDT